MQTRNQKYAMSAYKQVIKVSEEQKAKYGSMAHKLPILIRTAGLAQALAFVEAKAANESTHAWKKLLDDLAVTTGNKDKNDLVARSRQAELAEYMQLTREVLAALLWYKRFAQSELDVNSGEQDS